MNILKKNISNRKKRSIKIRDIIIKSKRHRLFVYKSSRHIYAQLISLHDSTILVSASTLEKKFFKKINYTGNKIAAKMVGKLIAKRSLKKGINTVSFDRAGFKYHGRIKSLAESARKFGLKF
ncbi:50S ribosomal protein L18 [Buchnera aphidicola]|uniref:50S ribosomal protein L18 n=1 Tax=Buchnera aphidicola TaxID=9 RepID=UPI0030EB2AC6